ncbi:hypothetical protein [Paradevosia shaoguanensis]|uniref:hypothetical protein n=1 Tax=Paradevosia shaoguanensis TaxID=1335043 RepID=UPI003C757BF9
MDYLVAFALVSHIAAAIFWAGTTMVQARIGNDHALELFRPQMGAATVTVIAGVILWWAYHSGIFYAPELSLAIGALAAIVAGILQIFAYRALKAGQGGFFGGVGVRRASAALMGIAILGMALSRVL